MAKLVDAPSSGGGAARHAGSSPVSGTWASFEVTKEAFFCLLEANEGKISAKCLVFYIINFKKKRFFNFIVYFIPPINTLTKSLIMLLIWLVK